MTNPAIYLRDEKTGKVLLEPTMIGEKQKVNAKGQPVFHRVVDTDATPIYKARKVPDDAETAKMLQKCDEIKDEYFKLRAKCIVALCQIYGKRRVELTHLKIENVFIEGELLHIIFIIAKKRKRGLFQYIQFLRDTGNPDVENKSIAELKEELKEWNKTDLGQRRKETPREKMTPLSDPYAQLIIQYWQYVKQHYPEALYLFPRGYQIPCGPYIVIPDKSLQCAQIWNIYKSVSFDSWPHLFRKRKGTAVARLYGRTLEGVTQVRDTLDLEREETAFHYIQDHAPKLETSV